MVPRAGLEPARLESRGILNPLCLPISPPRHIFCLDVCTSLAIWSDTRGSNS